MSTVHAHVTMLFGGDGTQAYRSPASNNNQARAESLTSTTRREFKGPKVGGRLSIDIRVDSSAGVTSATGVTLWYSNIPNPSITADTDWVQDTSVGTAGVLAALTATGTAFVDLSSRFAEHMMLKADVTAGTAGLRIFVRSEGNEV